MFFNCVNAQHIVRGLRWDVLPLVRCNVCYGIYDCLHFVRSTTVARGCKVPSFVASRVHSAMGRLPLILRHSPGALRRPYRRPHIQEVRQSTILHGAIAAVHCQSHQKSYTPSGLVHIPGTDMIANRTKPFREVCQRVCQITVSSCVDGGWIKEGAASVPWGLLCCEGARSFG